eukprot:629659-Rhodomonas_salina.3
MAMSAALYHGYSPSSMRQFRWSLVPEVGSWDMADRFRSHGTRLQRCSPPSRTGSGSLRACPGSILFASVLGRHTEVVFSSKFHCAVLDTTKKAVRYRRG